MGSKAVSNTGPIIHLTEINLIKILNIFQNITIPEEVKKELIKNNVPIPKRIKITKLKPESKDKTKILTNEYNLDLGEAEAISLALQEKVDYFLTDDLDARQIAKEFKLETHGTIGIILRAFKEKIISKEKTIEKIKELKTNSSLFITQDLISEVVESVKNFRG
ncbi:hypothetical protein A2647_05315 [Candidatus Nomurabacteria bacterium RIFCSPHIGHO2_01_FULL_40_24b]|uniref:DUF3368 domain-containing protein n=1 Tax=Candidatus Nomurabacteria bacterium RIFCSPHIGHO2_01_FULL_40_24b TaxID=1801739 RepID=A0A1F6V6M2_9BACT|nr:MAG: hypothetical protein A2647_05315 [Candidatus Nomurabacteria bacterium RIFCSPHIGHO2_01_FULL_40_24b]